MFGKKPTIGQIRMIKDSPLSVKELKRLTGLSASWINYCKGAKKPAKPIKQTSKKMTSKIMLYRKAKSEFLLENPACQVCGNTDALSIHHIAGRSGTLLYDKANFLVACMAGSSYLSDAHPTSNKRDGCHNWIESNLGLSKKLGYAKTKRYESLPDNGNTGDSIQ